MNALFDRLNLQPSERRLMVVLLIVLFVMLNMWLVFPHFQKRAIVRTEIQDNIRKLKSYQLETNRIPDLEIRLQELEARMGTNVLADLSQTQRRDFQRTIDRVEKESGVQIVQQFPITETKPLGTNTNQFFTEISMTIRVSALENQLVNFLYQISSGDSNIRVSDLLLKPTPNQTALDGKITLVSSFRKVSENSTGNLASARTRSVTRE